MAEALTATARIMFQYVVNLLPHKLNVYMAYNDVLGQHQMVDRDGITTVLWTLGAQYLWDKIRVLYDASSLPAAATISLFHRSGTLWNLIDVATLTGVGTNGTPAKLAVEATWVVRDTAFKKLRFVVLESTSTPLGHSATGRGLGSAFDAVSSMLDGADTDASAPYRWVKSRGDRFLAASGAIAGLTFATNDKLRRARHLT